MNSGVFGRRVPGTYGRGPKLSGKVNRTPIEIVEMSLVVAKKVAGQKLDHARRPTTVAPQIDYYGVGVGEESHGRAHRGPGELRVRKRAQAQIADVAGESFDPFEAEIKSALATSGLHLVVMAGFGLDGADRLRGKVDVKVSIEAAEIFR